MVFYTGFVDAARQTRANRLNAGITADAATVVGLLRQMWHTR